MLDFLLVCQHYSRGTDETTVNTAVGSANENQEINDETDEASAKENKETAVSEKRTSLKPPAVTPNRKGKSKGRETKNLKDLKEQVGIILILYSLKKNIFLYIIGRMIMFQTS